MVCDESLLPISRREQELPVGSLEAPGKTRYYLILGYLTLGTYADTRREADEVLAEGLSPRTFGELRAVVDGALVTGAPAGSLRIGSGARPPWSGFSAP